MRFVRRYTNLAGVIHILTTKQLTLLNPDSWDDGNDSYFMKQYKSKIGAKSVSALCFAQASETYHHWRVFSAGGDGVCLDFDKVKLEEMFSKEREITTKDVKYLKIDALKSSDLPVCELPFVKRIPYKDECEWRVVHTAKSVSKNNPNYNISLEWINGIYLSPWMPSPLVSSVKTVIKSIKGCNDLRVFQTTLLDNKKWKSIADRSSL